MHLNRRHFLKHAGAAAVAFTGLYQWSRLSGTASAASTVEGYGPLLSDPEKILDLPEGFSYQLISSFGDSMDDGLTVPGMHDGMCALRGPNGKTILIRNHELSPNQTQYSGFGENAELLSRIAKEKIYDTGKGKAPCLGGTTTLIYDTRTRELDRHFLSLAGTTRNCAGGPTPWNSWITCEENVDRAGDNLDQDHGYNFEVPATDQISLADPVPLKAMGRFNHEAVAVDPRTGIVYQTEDRHDGLFYRFIPRHPGRLADGGKLQALRVRDQRGMDTRNWYEQNARIGEPLAVEWVTLRDVESREDDLRLQGHYGKGAARFARGEGIWHGNKSFYFACTNGGKKLKGQIWRYQASPYEGTRQESENPGTLELFIEPNDGNLVENADNLTVAPWGDLVICEDGASPQFLVGVTPEGAIYKLGRTSISELAGATFSPDGGTLFVNIQSPGRTLAITGPWQRRIG